MSLSDAFEHAEEPLPRGTVVVVVRDQETADGERVPAGTQARVQEPWGVHGRPRAGPVAIATLGGLSLQVPRAALVLQRGGPTPPAPAQPDRARWERLRGALQLVTLVGSQAWNLAVAGSDEDRRGCYLAPFELLASLEGAPEQLEDPDADGVYWELEKLLRLGLKADPNVIEALWGPVVQATPFGERLLATRQAFLSRRVLDTFGRYALAQLERLEARERRNRLLEEAAALWRAPGGSGPQAERTLVERLEQREGLPRRRAGREAQEVLRDLARSLHDRGLIPDRHPRSVETFLRDRPEDPTGWLVARSDKPKNAMHLLRILHSGLRLIEGGPPLIRVEEGPLRQRLLAVRAGQVPFPEVVLEARGLAARLEEAGRRSPLPPEGDRAAAEALLREGRRLACPASRAAPIAAPIARAPAPLPGLPEPLLRRFLAGRAERPFLAVVSGSHAYGFPSADSDVDLKALHLAPLRDLLGLGPVPETVDFLGLVEGVELDYTSHELGKACQLLLRGNGNLLEWVLGELVVQAHPRAAELRRLARQNLHRGFARHYAGFSRALRGEYLRGREEAGAGRVKPLLYALRSALSGLHLMRSGECLPHLPRLLAACPGYEAARELVDLKRGGDEQVRLTGDDAGWLDLVARAQAELEAARASSPLPEEAPARAALSAWLADLRRDEGRDEGDASSSGAGAV